MFDEIFESTKLYGTGIQIQSVCEVSLAQVRREISNPDMRPGLFDVTFEGWLARIETWGKINYKWNNPEGFGKKTLTKSQFLKHVTDANLLQAFGVWHIQQYSVNKMDMYREYIGMNGKKYTDKFTLEVDLKPELKKALK